MNQTRAIPVPGVSGSTLSACPVCRRAAAEPFIRVDDLDYWRCLDCGASFLDRAQLPSAEDEHRHYLHHENDPGDPAYRRFLARLADPLLERMPAGLSGLDYGCGPGPALAVMLREAGHAMAVYDPFFRPDRGRGAPEIRFRDLHRGRRAFS